MSNAELIAEARRRAQFIAPGISSRLLAALATALEQSEASRDTDWRRFVELTKDEQIADLERRWKAAEEQRDLLKQQLAKIEEESKEQHG